MANYPTIPGSVPGSDTSAAAAESIDAGNLRLQALGHLRAAGPRGLTSDELEAITGWRSSTASARLRELVLLGDAYDTRDRRRTRTGRTATVRRYQTAPPGDGPEASRTDAPGTHAHTEESHDDS